MQAITTNQERLSVGSSNSLKIKELMFDRLKPSRKKMVGQKSGSSQGKISEGKLSVEDQMGLYNDNNSNSSGNCSIDGNKLAK